MPASTKMSSVAAGLGNRPREFNIFGNLINNHKVKSYAPVRAEKVIKKEQEVDIKPIIQKTLVPIKALAPSPSEAAFPVKEPQ